MNSAQFYLLNFTHKTWVNPIVLFSMVPNTGMFSSGQYYQEAIPWMNFEPMTHGRNANIISTWLSARKININNIKNGENHVKLFKQNEKGTGKAC